MIFGIGTDIVQISRIEAAMHRIGDRFCEKILGADELVIFLERKVQSDVRALRYLATRFAAKEAFSKAIGLGFRMPMTWHAVQIINDVNGRPAIVTNGALFDWMSSQGLSAKISMSDESEYAVAFAIVEQV